MWQLNCIWLAKYWLPQCAVWGEVGGGQRNKRPKLAGWPVGGRQWWPVHSRLAAKTLTHSTSDVDRSDAVCRSSSIRRRTDIGILASYGQTNIYGCAGFIPDFVVGICGFCGCTLQVCGGWMVANQTKLAKLVKTNKPPMQKWWLAIAGQAGKWMDRQTDGFLIYRYSTQLNKLRLDVWWTFS